MPNIKSAKKRLRTSQEAYGRNVGVRSRVKTQRRNFMEAVAENDKERSDKAYRVYCSVLDKAAKSNVIKKNTAQRRKARAADKLRAMA
jgi:small subunit ribosomal protein S20